MIVDNKVYSINVGDSRAFLSSNHGSVITQITQDHKPLLKVEEERIRKSGGTIYRSYIQAKREYNQPKSLIYGPYRVKPGRLSVSRTIGDS